MAYILNPNPGFFAPLSKVIMSPSSTEILTANWYTPISPILSPVLSPVQFLDYDTGMNSNPIVQRNTTKYLMFRMLDEWLYTEKMCHVLKYLKISDGVVHPIQTEKDFNDNKLCEESNSSVEKKADFIHKHILSLDQMRELLEKTMNRLGYKWYELIQVESVIVEIVEKHLTQELKAMIGRKVGNSDD